MSEAETETETVCTTLCEALDAHCYLSSFGCAVALRNWNVFSSPKLGLAVAWKEKKIVKGEQEEVM